MSAPSVPADEFRSFDYRPVPALVPVAAFFAFTGLIGFLTVVGVPVALIGLFLAAVALLKIVRSGGEYGGRNLAAGALVLSAIGFFGGTATQAVAYATEVPEGFRRISFRDDPVRERLRLHPGRARPRTRTSRRWTGSRSSSRATCIPSGRWRGCGPSFSASTAATAASAASRSRRT